MAQKLVVPLTFNIYQGETLVRTDSFTQSPIKIGRDQKSHVRLEDDSVSRMHAVIEAKPGEVQIIDLGSGTFVNGHSVNKCQLNVNDEIRIGNSRIVIAAIGEAVDEAVAQAQKAAPPPPPPATSQRPPVPSVPPMGAGLGMPASPAVPAMAAGFAAPPFAAPGLPPFGAPPFGAPAPGPSGVDGEEIYQLIKRGDINPHEVEDVGSQAVEVSILWKTAILHVAHLDGTKDFELEQGEPTERINAGFMDSILDFRPQVIGPRLVILAGVLCIVLAMAMTNYLIGGLGTLMMLGGVLVAGVMDHKEIDEKRDVAKFVVGPEILQGMPHLPVVLNKGGATRVVIPAGASGEAEIEGQRRPIQDLVAGGIARPSSVSHGGHELDVRPNGRYKVELGGLSMLVKVVAPGRRVAGVTKRDPAMVGAGIGSAVGVAALILAMRFAVADDSGFLSQGNDEDRLNELRAFIARQQERQPEQPQQQNADDQQEGGTGTRHAGPEGKMGKRDAPSRSARYAIRNNGEPPHLSRQAAREAVQNRGIFAALGSPGGGMAGGASGIVSPFGGLTESGMDNQNANGNMTGDTIGDAFGYGGLGATGTGWGGGGTGEGTIGLGNIGTMGHGSGTGSGQGYGAGAGRGLRQRANTGPLVRAAPPSVTGLLSPEAIRRVVLRNLGQVSHCHEQGLMENPNLEGRVVIRFVIGGTGTVLGSNVAESSVAVPSVAQCIANAVRRWQFPSPEGGGIVTVNYPFNLQHPE